MNIRTAQSSDQTAIKTIVRAAHVNPMNLDWQRFLVAEEDGQVIGVGQVKAHGDGRRELASIATLSEYQHHGVASEIVKELLARERGPLYLFCRSSLETFYQRFGFQRVGPDQMPPYFKRMYGIGSFFWKVTHSPVQVIVMKR